MAAGDEGSASRVVWESHGAGLAEGGLSGPQEVRAGFDSGEFCGLTEAVEKRGDFGASFRSRAVVILPADDDSPQSPLGGVVVERDARVLEETGESLPQTQQVFRRSAQAATRQGFLASGKARRGNSRSIP